jgi:menaquinone-specific isochorismate synthase
MHPLSTDEILNWLRSESRYPKVYWKEKGSDEARAAVGAAHTWNTIPSLDPREKRRAYGGMRFGLAQHKPSVWGDFPDCLFWLPEEERCAPSYTVCCNPPKMGNPTERIHSPLFTTWENNIHRVLEAICLGHLDKLVLARQTTWTLDAPPSVWDFISSLGQQQQTATLFAFELEKGLAFFGATPELLFQKKGSQISIDALAGTRGPTQKELLQAPKERREFDIVKEALEALLRPLSTSLRWGNDTLLKAGHLEHLYNRLVATLCGAPSDTDLIRILHPTPALGGYPKEAALRLLDEIEPFDRGWYGAPLGCVSVHTSSFYVGIRSALLKGNHLHTFAGAGIVKGSTPEAEWEELDRKMQTITKACLQP